MTDKRCLLSCVQELRNSETEESVSGFRRNNRRSDKPKFELKKRELYQSYLEKPQIRNTSLIVDDRIIPTDILFDRRQSPTIGQLIEEYHYLHGYGIMYDIQKYIAQEINEYTKKKKGYLFDL